MGLVEQSKQTPILAYGVEPYSLKRKLAFYIWTKFRSTKFSNTYD